MSSAVPAIAVLFAASLAVAQDTAAIEQMMRRGEADNALAALQRRIKQQSSDAAAQNLACRIDLQLSRHAEAAAACQIAANLSPNNAEYALWLGRALGEQAEHANPVSAYRLARQSRISFENAVRLDPRNVDAWHDLGEFYLDAPAVLGGGTAKAREVAAKLDSIDPAGAHWLRAKIAEQQKDLGAAETEFLAATKVSRSPGSAWMDLASFFRRQGRTDQMLWAVREGEKRAQPGSSALYDGAGLLLMTGRELPLAAEMLERYIRDRDYNEGAPLFAAEARLAQIYQKLGKPQDAAREQSAFHALAGTYVIPEQHAH